MSEAQETDFRLPEEWEVQEILDEKVVREKTYYLIGWKPTLVPEMELSTALLQAWRDEMDNLVSPNRDSVLESHVVLQRCDQWLGTIIGEEVVGGATYYRVQWEPTFEPASIVARTCWPTVGVQSQKSSNAALVWLAGQVP